MGELQKLYVALALDASEYESGLRGAEQQAQGFGGRITGALTTVGRVGGAALLGVGAAAAGGFALAMGSAIEMNASLETSTLQFTTLMGDADLASAHVAALFDFAANTPFETGPIIDASLKLQTFGGEALNSMENLTLVGDAAAAVGAPIDEVAFWVGRLYSNLQAGQPFGEAAMRLQELGIMAPEARGQLEGMQAAGASGMDIFAAFQGQLGTFSGAMQAQAGTWQGLTSTIKDQLSLLTAEALKPFFDLAKEGMAGLAQWLSSPEVQAAITTLAGHIRTMAEAVQDFVMNKVVPFVQDHGPQLKQILIALAAAFGALLIIGAVAAAIALLTNPITWIVAAVGALAAAWTMNWGGIRDKTEAVVSFLRGLIESFLAAVRGWWEQHGEAITAAAQQAWELIQGLIDGVVEHIQLVVEAFRAAFEGDWETFGAKIFEIWENAWNTVVEFLSGLWDMVLPWLVSLWESIKAWFTGTDWPQLGRNVIDGIVNGLRSAGQAIIDVIMGFMREAWERIKSFWGIESPSRLMDWAGQMVINGFVGGILRAIQENRPALMTGLEGLVHDVTGVLDMAGNVGGIAGGFARRFEQQVTGPMEAQLAALDATLGELMPGIAERWEQLTGFAMADWENPAHAHQALEELYRFLRGTMPGSALNESIQAAIDAMVERNDLEDEYIRQQERLLALENARADMEFLKSQLDLLSLIQENAAVLPADILAGVQLGLAGDPGQLMDITVAVMEALVRNASQELNLSSQPTNAPVIPGETRGNWNVQNQTINGGQHNYFYGAEESELERMAVLGR